MFTEQPFYKLAQLCGGILGSDYCRVLRTRSGTPGPKYHFGFRVPFGIKQAIQFDKENGNDLWLVATRKELDSMSKYNVLRFRNNGEQTLKEPLLYHITLSMMFNMMVVIRQNW